MEAFTKEQLKVIHDRATAFVTAGSEQSREILKLVEYLEVNMRYAATTIEAHSSLGALRLRSEQAIANFASLRVDLDRYFAEIDKQYRVEFQSQHVINSNLRGSARPFQPRNEERR